MKTMLVIDDEYMLRDLVDCIFQPRGYRVLQAENGERGLELLRNNPDTTFVLTDLQMGAGMNGIETVRAIRAFSEVRVVLWSGTVDEDQAREAVAAGAEQVIHKPVSEAVLVKAVGEHESHEAVLGA